MSAPRFKVEYLKETRYEPAGWALIDTTTNEAVGRDGGEPEDQLLIRDWKWVPELTNALAARAEAAERHLLELLNVLEARTAQRDDAVATLQSCDIVCSKRVTENGICERTYGHDGDCQ